MDIRLMMVQLLILIPIVVSAYKKGSNKPNHSRSLSLFNTSSSYSTIFVRIRDLPDPPWLIIPVFFSEKAEAQEIVGDSSRELEKTDPSNELDYDYCRGSCPRADQIVRDTVGGLCRARPDFAPILLQLVFHDCLFEGFDALLILDSTRERASEKDSLRGFEVIDTVKLKLEEECPGIVSCADMLVLATRDSVSLFGGPCYPVFTGTRDSTLSFPDPAKTELPSPHDSLPVLLGTNEPGLSLDTEFLQLMRTQCNHTRIAAEATADNVSYEKPPMFPLNYEGSAFESQYFRSLLQGKGILYDQQLTAAEETGKSVRACTLNATMIRRDFASR